MFFLYSITQCVFIFEGCPGRPAAIFVKFAFSKEMEIEWKPPLYDGGLPVIKYHVFKSVGNGKDWIEIATTFPCNTSLIVNGLKTGKYKFSVSAQNECGFSDKRITRNSVFMSNTEQEYGKNAFQSFIQSYKKIAFIFLIRNESFKSRQSNSLIMSDFFSTHASLFVKRPYVKCK